MRRIVKACACSIAALLWAAVCCVLVLAIGGGG